MEKIWEHPLFTSLVGAVVGAVLGSLLTFWITYKFQKKLLVQQLEAQQSGHEELLAAIKAAGEQAQMQISSAVHSASQRSRIS